MGGAGGAGEAVDCVGARAEEGLGEGEADVACCAEDEDSRHGSFWGGGEGVG